MGNLHDYLSGPQHDLAQSGAGGGAGSGIVVVPGGGARYLPAYFAGRPIYYRMPWTLPGELIVAPQGVAVAFQPAVFQNNTDKPFEIHDILFAGAQIDDNDVPIADPAPGIDFFWRVRMKDLSKNEDATNAPQLVASLVERNTRSWPQYMPYTIVRSEGFRVQVDNLIAAGGNRIRAAVTFRGYLLTLGPASEEKR